MTEPRDHTDPILRVRNLKMHFPVSGGGFRKPTKVVKAVNDISFDISRGETLGIVGESGSGKSTMARAVLRAYDPTDGVIEFKTPDESWRDITHLSESEMRPIRRHMQMIFQDPYSSLNSRMTLLQLVSEPMVNAGITNKTEMRDRVAELLTKVGLRPEVMNRYPHAFSGGQRQRIGIARALALNPIFVAADESVSALDVSIAAQTINLLQDIQEELGLTYLFITHDLSMVAHISDRIGVMYAGQLVELAETDAFFERPRHPYSEVLLSAIPIPDPKIAKARVLLPSQGEVADPANLPSGCSFAARCPYATDLCRSTKPELMDAGASHMVRCHHAADIELKGPLA